MHIIILSGDDSQYAIRMIDIDDSQCFVRMRAMFRLSSMYSISYIYFAHIHIIHYHIADRFAELILFQNMYILCTVK